MGKIGFRVSKKRCLSGRLILMVILPFFIAGSSSLAVQVGVFSVKVFRDSGRDRITIRLEGLRLKPVQEVIEGGIPYTLEYRVRVKEERPFWDRTVWEGVYSRTLKFNLITKEYRIEDQTSYPERFSDKESFLKKAGVATFPLPEGMFHSEKGRSTTYLEVRVRRNSVHLFFPLSLIAPLIRPDSDFDTGWIRVKR
jgi:hypothetical protein